MGKKTERIKNTSIVLSNCRLSYVNLVEPYQFLDDGVKKGEPKWTVRAHIPKSDKKLLATLKTTVDLYKEKFDFSDRQSNIHDGDKKTNNDGDPVCPGHVFINANCFAEQNPDGSWVDPDRLRICVVKDGAKVEIENKNAGFIKDGAVVTLLVQPAYYSGFGGGLTFYLNEVLYHKQGEPFYSRGLELPDEDSELPSDFMQEPTAEETSAEAERAVEEMLGE